MLAKPLEAFFDFAGNSEADPASECQTILAIREDTDIFFPCYYLTMDFLNVCIISNTILNTSSKIIPSAVYA